MGRSSRGRLGDLSCELVGPCSVDCLVPCKSKAYCKAILWGLNVKQTTSRAKDLLYMYVSRSETERLAPKSYRQ